MFRTRFVLINFSVHNCFVYVVPSLLLYYTIFSSDITRINIFKETMTQLSNDSHLAKSNQKSSQILNGNKGKVAQGISSQCFYGGNSNSRPRTQLNMPYVMCSRAVRSSSPFAGKLMEFHSVPPPAAPEIQREPLRTSLTSPRKRKFSSLAPDSRAKRILTYAQAESETSSQEFSPDDESNKENWEHGTKLAIHTILETLDRDMEKEAAKSKEVPESSEDNETRAPQTPPRQTFLPQEIGFPNPPGSNRCWMNATLQMLLGMDVFVEQLEQSCWRDERTGQSAVLRAFFDVVRLRKYGRRNSLFSALRRLSHSLGALDSMFISDRQQDATEFLVRLLDLFREQYSVTERCTLRELQLDNVPAQRTEAQNPVSENVEFRLKETYCCDTCGETSSKSQDHLALFLDVPPTSGVRPSLQEALSRYMEPDVRELRCSRCSGQRTRVQTVFTKLPRYLVVQVKRYAVQTAIAEKVTDLLRVSINLSLKNFVTNDVTQPTPWCPVNKEDNDEAQMEEEEDKELQEAMQRSLKEEDVEEDLELEKAIQLSLQEQQATVAMQNADISTGDDMALEREEDSSPDLSYRLVCIIMHQGLSPNCGHYVADVYNPQQQQWYHYDDEYVSHPAEEEVLNKTRQRNGYVFCYMHRSLFDKQVQRHSEEELLW